MLIFTLELSPCHKGKCKAELWHCFFSGSCTPEPSCADMNNFQNKHSASGKDFFQADKVAAHLFTYFANLSARERIKSLQANCQDIGGLMDCKPLGCTDQLFTP